ncbi:MAG: PqqD family protein [Acidobacteria bacterium]|nr:PqqD family protein [Acidobacteriota bacterium]
MSSVFYRIQSPHVIREQFDDEVVIVNLESGAYYSLDDVGAVVWTCLEQKQPIVEIVASVRAKYAGETAEIETGTHQFLELLCSEGLINADPTWSTLSSSTAGSIYETGTSKLNFTAPKLNKYTDMQDLLLLDPIHEVDETGWPTAKTSSSTN